jgi:hypothetical protein
LVNLLKGRIGINQKAGLYSRGREIAVEIEAPPEQIVDPPPPEPLALGRVLIQYRTENLRVMPVFGKDALDVSLASAVSTPPSTTRRGTLWTPAAKR